MPPVATPARPSAPVGSAPSVPLHKAPRRPNEAPAQATPVPPHRNATDDEILGLAPLGAIDPESNSQSASKMNRRSATSSSRSVAESEPTDDALLSDRATELDPNSTNADGRAAADASPDLEDRAASRDSVSPELQAVLDSNPDLRRAWQDRESYRQFFATPEEARAATAQLRDLDRMDALFFSQRPEDHAQLAAAVAALDPAAFASLAQAMNKLSAAPGSRGAATLAANLRADGPASSLQQHVEAERSSPAPSHSPLSSSASSFSPAQSEFLHATNAAAVESVLGAIESQVDKLLPEGVSKNSRNRVVGEIYRELDSTLRSNRQFTQQLRDAMGGALAQPDGGRDANHQRAIVSLIAGRARQALPAVAKRVLNEWTSTIVAANQERRGRQREAERRVDIAGSSGAGNDGRRPITPRDINYSRMSDADILNL
jgi:hypothetical protein